MRAAVRARFSDVFGLPVCGFAATGTLLVLECPLCRRVDLDAVVDPHKSVAFDHAEHIRKRTSVYLGRPGVDHADVGRP